MKELKEGQTLERAAMRSSTNWRGEPLMNYETIVRLIATTTTAAGLQVTCTLDRRKYAVGKKVSDAEMKAIRIVKDKFHGEWNYTIRPNPLNDHL